MKVSTDACLFGACIETGKVKSILDIGAGTGLLTLMLAQKCEARIDAVEIDDTAFQQAKENISNSLWKERISVHHADILEWAKQNHQKFDLIISNPPFFSNHFKSEKEKKNLAKHTDSLSQKDLLKIILNLLNKDGSFCLILPKKEMEDFILFSSKQNLLLNKKISVRNYKDSEVFRTISSFSFKHSHLETEEIIIWDSPGNYSDKFMQLLRPYYLYL